MSNRVIERIYHIFFFSSRRRHTRCSRDWSSDVCSSDLAWRRAQALLNTYAKRPDLLERAALTPEDRQLLNQYSRGGEDRKSTRLNSSHGYISYAVFCLKKKKKENEPPPEQKIVTKEIAE